uniref:Menorin-like domain-containing protein n=1 Tax=Timema genevievae TaxID=629358 RepID=A0A7R9PNT9_TIMGE|nr:unnamed protein product [Timema genevievae]
MCSYKILSGGTTTKCSRIPWQTSVMCFFVILALMKIASCEVLPSVKKFFPFIKNDLTKVTWANDVGTENGINVARIVKSMMISGYVIYRGRNKIPWMEHDNSASGISLQDLLYKVAKVKSMGVQLNFGSTNGFEEAIKVLQTMRGKLTFPLWLHADTDNMEEKDVDDFLSLCTHNFPEATISIGFFRKGYKAPQKPKEYEAELITKMKDTLTRNNVTQTVAFPVEIRSAALSLDTLQALKDVPGITDSALYMYGGLTGADDYLDVVSKIRNLINDFGKDRVYLNLHPNLVKDLI